MAKHPKIIAEPAAPAPAILVVDDDQGLLRLITKSLEREGLRAETADSGQKALAWLAKHHVDLLLLDLKLQDIEGKELIERLVKSGRCPAFIIMTGQGDERVAVEMMKRGALDYLVKDADFLPFVPAVVRRALGQLYQQRRLAEAEAQVHLVRSAIDQGFSAVLITDAELPDPRVVYINPPFAEATGYSAEEIVGRRLSALANLASLRQRLQNAMSEAERFTEEITSYQTPQGERWGEWRFGPVKSTSGLKTHWLIIFRDITDRKKLEKEILEISDRERRRIGQDLHDGLCQHLAGIELMSQVLAQKLATKTKAASAQVAEIARHVRDAIGQTRALARGLAPVTLESEGLVSALQELSAGTERMFGVSCHFTSEDWVSVRDSTVATHLYRIAQEAVSNAIKHGKATEIDVRLERVGGRIVLTINNSGTGLPADVTRSNGMGLRIMEYRASMIHGSLSIQNRDSGGVSVTCSVPGDSAA